MSAPAKFLFDVDFAAPDKKEKPVTPAEIAASDAKQHQVLRRKVHPKV